MNIFYLFNRLKDFVTSWAFRFSLCIFGFLMGLGAVILSLTVFGTSTTWGPLLFFPGFILAVILLFGAICIGIDHF